MGEGGGGGGGGLVHFNFPIHNLIISRGPVLVTA